MAIALTYTKKETRKKGYEILRNALDNEFTSFETHLRDLNDFILSRRAQFTLSDNNRGERRNLKIINSTATLSARTLRSGMMGGITSPARPWYKLSTHDPALAEYGPVKEWLHAVTSGMRSVHLRSNLYNSLPIVYGDVGVFATAAMLVEEHFDKVLHTTPLPIGSYRIALNNEGMVETFFREFRWTVRQVVQEFGEYTANGELLTHNLSQSVQNALGQSNLDQHVDICHVIQRNSDYSPDRFGSKMYESVYYEKTTETDKNSPAHEIYLRDAGYDYFPVLAPRWEVSGGDIYGTDCPGMTGLGDIKALQTMEKRKAQAVEKMVNPPMKGPVSMRGQSASVLPGDMTYTDEREGQKGFGPVYEIDPRVNELSVEIAKHEARIQRAFYEDLFLMLAQSDRREITAREIDERHQEKLLALGPVLEGLNQDLLDPLIDITFLLMHRQGLLPPPPPELENEDLKVEYISIMHQAQKIAGLEGIERFTDYALNLAAANPQVLDKVDFDQAIDEVGDITGVPPGIVVSDEVAGEVRARRDQVMQQREDAQNAATAANSAKDLAGADLEGDNALSAMVEQSQAGAA